MHKKRLLSLILIMPMVLTATVNFDAASRPEKVKGVTAASIGKKTVTLKWKKAKRAKYYQIYKITKTYRSHGKTKYKYKKVGTTKKRTYKIKNLKPGKRYKFRLRAVRGKKKGKLSKIKAVTPKKASAGSTSFKLQFTPLTNSSFKISWNKIKGASKYTLEVQDDDYNIIKSVTTKNLSYTIKNVKKGSYDIWLVSDNGTSILKTFNFKGDLSDKKVISSSSEIDALIDSVVKARRTSYTLYCTSQMKSRIMNDDYHTPLSLLVDCDLRPESEKVTINGNTCFEIQLHPAFGLSASRQTECINKANNIAAILTGTDREKILKLNTYFIENCTYDYSYNNYNAYDVILSHKAVCQGFSNAAEAILNMVGVETRTVSGSIPSGSHAWNTSKINGSWYHCDFTTDVCLAGGDPIVTGYILCGTDDKLFWSGSVAHKKRSDVNYGTPEAKVSIKP